MLCVHQRCSENINHSIVTLITGPVSKLNKTFTVKTRFVGLRCKAETICLLRVLCICVTSVYIRFEG